MQVSIKVRIDADRYSALCEEVASRQKLFENFRDLLLGELEGLRGGLGLGEPAVLLGPAAPDADDLVVRAEVPVGKLERLASALRALELENALHRLSPSP